jgi:hypothetical protein
MDTASAACRIRVREHTTAGDPPCPIAPTPVPDEPGQPQGQECIVTCKSHEYNTHSYGFAAYLLGRFFHLQASPAGRTTAHNRRNGQGGIATL